MALWVEPPPGMVEVLRLVGCTCPCPQLVLTDPVAERGALSCMLSIDHEPGCPLHAGWRSFDRVSAAPGN